MRYCSLSLWFVVVGLELVGDADGIDSFLSLKRGKNASALWKDDCLFVCLLSKVIVCCCLLLWLCGLFRAGLQFWGFGLGCVRARQKEAKSNADEKKNRKIWRLFWFLGYGCVSKEPARVRLISFMRGMEWWWPFEVDVARQKPGRSFVYLLDMRGFGGGTPTGGFLSVEN